MFEWSDSLWTMMNPAIYADSVADISNLSKMSPIADTCYVSVVLKMSSEPVISFSIGANSF
jgi:hypothetical protein